MADTIREQIIKHYITVLQGWTTLNSEYGLDIAGVYRAVKTVDVDMLPAAIVWALNETAEQTRYNKTECSMTMKVEVFSTFDEDENPSEIQEKLLGDLILIFTKQASLSVLAERVSYTGGGVAEFGAEEDVVGVYANFEIIYQTENGNPYA